MDKDQEGRWGLSDGGNGALRKEQGGQQDKCKGRWEVSAGTGMVSAGRGWRLERPDGTGGEPVKSSMMEMPCFSFLDFL